MSELWQGLIGALGTVLRLFHDTVAGVPLLEVAAWGWAIILLTAAVRLVLLPLAVKQTRSMRAMQSLQPEIKKLQSKYKTDRTMMKTDPEKYRERKAAQQQATMALYKEHGVNPAAGCLPLVAQMPIFFALFTLLRSDDYVAELGTATFYFTSLGESALAAGFGGIVLILAMAGTTYISQKQMMSHQPASAVQAQQKMMLYLMPVMLAAFSVNLPVGVLLYWATTNLWTMAQQYVMFRNVEQSPATPARPAGARQSK